MPKQAYTLINDKDKDLSPTMGQNMGGGDKGDSIIRIIFVQWHLLK